MRSRHGAIASSTQLQHLHEEVSQVQVRVTIWTCSMLALCAHSCAAAKSVVAAASTEVDFATPRQ